MPLFSNTGRLFRHLLGSFFVLGDILGRHQSGRKAPYGTDIGLSSIWERFRDFILDFLRSRSYSSFLCWGSCVSHFWCLSRESKSEGF